MNEIIKISFIDDDEIYSQIIQSALEENDQFDITCHTSGEDFLNSHFEKPDIVIIDYSLPGKSGLEVLQEVKKRDPEIKTIILSGQDKLEVVVDAYDKGADQYIIKNENVLFQLKHTLKTLGAHINLQKEVVYLRSQILDRKKYSRIVGESAEIISVLKLIQKIEATNLTTLLTGESGTGKEVVAESIHYNSTRKKHPFVAVNVAGIPSDLIESEFFGHEKGAFTGASSRRIGRFEEADGGTLFLDEIGEMPVELQSKLLRVLQDFKVSRLGSNKEKKLDLRIIAATNKNLHQLVQAGKFREDLMYRLQGFLIHLPPLRDRGNDVILLANYFLEEFTRVNKSGEKTLSNAFVKNLLDYNWPGNIRELKSVIERAAILSDSNIIGAEDFIVSFAPASNVTV